MSQNEIDQRNAAFNELRSFWENGTDPIRALGYLRTKYPDNALQYAAGELAYHRPQNNAYRVGISFPELENFQFSTPRASQISPVAQDMGAQIANKAYAFAHQPQATIPVNPSAYRVWENQPSNTQQSQAVTPAIPSDEEIVNDIIRNNKYGTGATRKQNLLNLGLTNDDYERIRGLVNARMYASRAAARPRVSTPVPAPQPQQRRYYQGMPMSGNWGVQDIM